MLINLEMGNTIDFSRYIMIKYFIRLEKGDTSMTKNIYKIVKSLKKMSDSEIRKLVLPFSKDKDQLILKFDKFVIFEISPDIYISHLEKLNKILVEQFRNTILSSEKFIDIINRGNELKLDILDINFDSKGRGTDEETFNRFINAEDRLHYLNKYDLEIRSINFKFKGKCTKLQLNSACVLQGEKSELYKHRSELKRLSSFIFYGDI